VTLCDTGSLSLRELRLMHSKHFGFEKNEFAFKSVEYHGKEQYDFLTVERMKDSYVITEE
jgi:hypothetical protein